MADAGVAVDTINASASIHTTRVRAILVVGLAVEAREAKRACACVGINILCTGGSVTTRPGLTLVNVHFTVLACEPIHAKTTVVSHCIQTRTSILTRNCKHITTYREVVNIEALKIS